MPHYDLLSLPVKYPHTDFVHCVSTPMTLAAPVMRVVPATTWTATTYSLKPCSPRARDWSAHARPICYSEVMRLDRWPRPIVLEEGLRSKLTMSSSYSGLGILFESAMVEGEALLVLRLLR